MIFNTLTFYALFIVFLAIYAVVRRTSRTAMMLYVTAMSIAFFYKANAELCFLLPATALFSWAATKKMSEKDGSARKWWTAFIVIVDLIPLIYYKYTNFGISLINDIFNQNFPLLEIILPIGISFYTFQAISHTVDVYRRKFTMDVTVLEYFFYLTFFPLLLAGPITRAETFFPQVRKTEPVEEKMLYTGLWLIMIGLIKKSVIADYIAQYNNWIFDDPLMYSGFENLMGAIGYTVQIYCDFSGYSDMSIGIAALMGIQLKENFNFPYQSMNVTEFWRRWHIALSTWFRDYIYIPLGGNRKGMLRTDLNNFITMLVAGLWHGSTLMFVLWGALHGAALLVHKTCKKLFLDKIPTNVFTTPVFWLMTHIFVIATWVIFRAENMEVCGNVFSQIFTDFDMEYLPYFLIARPTWTALIVIAYLLHATRERHYYGLQELYIRTPWIVKVLLFLVVIQLAVQFHTSSVQPFIYYQF